MNIDKQMHVGIITYQTGHLKTWQILKKLLSKSFKVTLFAFPFYPKPQKRSCFEDRPFQLIDINIKDFCRNHNVGYEEVEGWDEESCLKLESKQKNVQPDTYLTCIAKIIPQSFIKDRIIINAHPGLLPENRGIDAFKWSIVNGWPIGVSLHVINEKIDSGILLHRMRVPVFSSDSLSDVATRAYEMECDLQANFDYFLEKMEASIMISDNYPVSKKRIPKELDSQLEKVFKSKKEKLINLSRQNDFKTK